MHKPARHVWLEQEHEDKAWSLVKLIVAGEALLWEKVAGGVGFGVQQGRDGGSQAMGRRGAGDISGPGSRVRAGGAGFALCSWADLS